jgi:hypothetical protein
VLTPNALTALWGPPVVDLDDRWLIDAELRRERWLRAQGHDVGHVVRVLPATERDPEEILFLTGHGDPETARVHDDGSISLDIGW